MFENQFGLTDRWSRKLKNEIAVGRGSSAGTVFFFFFFTKCFEIPINTEPTDAQIKILLNNVVNITLYRVLLMCALGHILVNNFKKLLIEN